MSENNDRDRQLINACMYGDIKDVVALLHAGANPNAVITEEPEGALWVASAGGESLIVEALLKAGAKPNGKSLFVASMCNHVGVLKLLVPHADQHSKDMALHTVKSVEAARLLLEAGANVNSVDNDLYTPLHRIALRLGFDEGCAIAKLFIDSGADINAKTRYGHTPLKFSSDNPSLRGYLRQNGGMFGWE